MNPRVLVVVGLAVVLALATGAALTAVPRSNRSSSDLSFALEQVNPACPANLLGQFDNVVPLGFVDDVIDELFEEAFDIECFVQGDLRGNQVRNLRGRFQTELIFLDLSSGRSEVFPTGQGRFNTRRQGFDTFETEITQDELDTFESIFSDGFESGDVSVWSHTTTEATNRKKVDTMSVICGKNTSNFDTSFLP